MRSLRFGKSIAVLILVLVGVGCLPVVAVLPWRWIDPPTSAFMLRASVEGTDVDRTWVDWDSIAPEMVVAVIAAEDQRFLDHHGFDFAAIREAMAEDRPRRRGASTLTQQVAKNLFLWPAYSWFRKGLEAALTVWIEVLWPKRRILEIYLNTAELGPGVYGVEAASRRFFEKSAAELTTGEAALLAAVLPSPVKLSAARPSAYVERRAAWIRRQMRQLGGRALLAGV